MIKFSRIKGMSKINNWIFNQFHGKKLVYNTCWEDPVCDKQLLNLDQDSEIVMITSAGCNALSYLLDDPKSIASIDMNYRQNSVMELKKALFNINNFDLLEEYFAEGKVENYREKYQSEIRDQLPAFAQEYWDDKIKYFSGKGNRKTFYYRGTSGALAWMFGKYLRANKNLNTAVQNCFNATNLPSQKEIYEYIDQKLYSPLLVWFFNRHAVMSLAGVPKSQQELYINKYSDGNFGFMKSCLKGVFTQVPANKNYFWQLYYHGKYSENCRPEYLEKQNYDTLRDRVDRIHTHTTTISQYLKDHPGTYSHYVLLDHQDWLAANDEAALREEWELILQNSRPGTRILLRSAAEEIDFFPSFVTEKVDFQLDIAARIHQQDRVGTYASTYLGIVK